MTPECGGPVIDNPSHYVPINVLLILVVIVMIIGTEIYANKTLTNPYKTYPRLRVRPRSTAYTYYIILTSICVLHLWDAIGYDKLPCWLGFISFLVFFQIYLVSASPILVFAYRVRISQLKRERDLVLYKRLKKEFLQRFKWLWRFLFLVIPVCTTITFIAMERETIFQGDCYGCDYVIPGAEYIPKVYLFLFAGSMFLVLIPVYSIRKYPDVFAHYPEFRLNFFCSFSFSLLACLIIAYDKELFGGIHSNKIFRGHWLLSVGVLISLFISTVYQFHLASTEGQLMNPNGDDFLSNIWNLIKLRCIRNQVKH